ncbi:MAG: hypothetical protein GY765_06155, partial [bacterium]|nr:hypothetical protein [bacterium]
MITLDSLLHKLEYNRSPHYCRVKTDEPPHPASAHLFRTAKTLNVAGIYVFERAPHGDTLQDGEVPGYSKSHHAPAPAVYVVEAEDVTAARKIHRKLWNLYFAPFAIILLPDQVRVYTGFNYSEEKDNDGLLEEAKNIGDLERILEALKATAIDTGMVWQSEYAKQLDTRKRVDRRLLKNIKQLGEALTRTGGLSDELANRLIGKYVYLKYLKDSGILTDEWMCEKSISPDGVFTLNATVAELSKLVQALEERFNGKVFPMHFENEEA